LQRLSDDALVKDRADARADDGSDQGNEKIGERQIGVQRISSHENDCQASGLFFNEGFSGFWRELTNEGASLRGDRQFSVRNG
jgi:hypothetical protein